MGGAADAPSHATPANRGRRFARLLLPPPLVSTMILHFLLQIAISAKRVAVLGIKTEAQASQPAFFVPEYLQSVGVEIIPVPGGPLAAAW